MDRTDIVNICILGNKAKNYLEIGIAGGLTLFNVHCKNKSAVDPSPEIPFMDDKYKNIKTYLKTSDDFFNELDKDVKYDVIFIDGLHTYDQSFRDIINSLDHLSENGIIVVHDCKPPNEVWAYPAESLEHMKSLNVLGFVGGWNGPVWKSILELRLTRQDLNIFTLDCDFGVCIITKGTCHTFVDEKITENDKLIREKIEALPFSYFEKYHPYFLNLRDPNYLFKFFQNIN